MSGRERPAPLGRAFGRVAVANVSSSFADGIALTAAPLLAARLTSDPVQVAVVAAVSMLPWLLFAIPAGVVLDRVDRRRALSGANTVRFALAALLAVLAVGGWLTLWWLYAVVFLFGVFETLYDGAIRAVIPSVVGRGQLARANSVVEGAETAVQNFLSAPLTSALFAVAVGLPLALCAGAYGLAALLAVFLPAAAAGSARSAPDAEVPWRYQLADGWRFIMGHRQLRTLWFLSTFVSLCFAAATATFVLFVLEHMGLAEAWYGWLMLIGAVGSLAGAWVGGRVQRRFRTGPTMAGANLVACAGLVAAGTTPFVPVVSISIAVSFAAVMVWNVNVMALRQSIPPAHLFGRVHGTWRTLLWGTAPLGSMLGGLLAKLGLQMPLILAGGAATIAGIIGFRFLAGLPDPPAADAAVDADADASPST